MESGKSSPNGACLHSCAGLLDGLTISLAETKRAGAEAGAGLHACLLWFHRDHGWHGRGWLPEWFEDHLHEHPAVCIHGKPPTLPSLGQGLLLESCSLQ